MKLTRDLPDRAGEWWCWSKEFSRPQIRYIGHTGLKSSSPLAIPAGITHFAGPVERPKRPEPAIVRIDCLIKMLCCAKEKHGNLPVCIDGHEMGDTADPFICGELKIGEQSGSSMGGTGVIVLKIS